MIRLCHSASTPFKRTNKIYKEYFQNGWQNILKQNIKNEYELDQKKCNMNEFTNTIQLKIK